MLSNPTLPDHRAYHLVNHVCPCGLHPPRLSICESDLSYIKQLQQVTLVILLQFPIKYQYSMSRYCRPKGNILRCILGQKMKAVISSLTSEISFKQKMQYREQILRTKMTM